MGRYVFFGGGIIVFSSFFAGLKREFSGYNAAKLVKDILAGLTVCAVALPLALAFGVSSGASAAAGLVTAIVAGIVIALLGGASFQISGPTGAMSAVLVGIVAAHGLQGVFFACFAAGVLLLIAGVLRLGRLISFIPMPVIMGFTSGIAIIIALGQIDNFFGTTSEGLTNIEKLLSYGRLGFHVNWQAALIGLLVVAVMVVWPKKWGARVPGSLVGIIAAAIVAGVFHMDSLATVGDIPRTLLLADRLDLSSLSFSMVKDLLSPIVTIAALGMIESLLCGASASRMKGEEFNADQELIAQGVGNGDAELFAAELDEGLLEEVEGGLKAAALLLGPDVIRVVAEVGLELGKAPAAAEVDLIDAAQAVEVHELVVDGDGLVVGVDGDDAGDIAGDGGGAEALEHADALVALLDVEAAHVLVAADGVAYALVAEVGGAELYPLEGELGVRTEQGHEIGRKGGAAALALGADYLVGGDVDDAEVDDAGDHGVVEYLVKDLKVRISPGEDAFAVGFLPGL